MRGKTHFSTVTSTVFNSLRPTVVAKRECPPLPLWMRQKDSFSVNGSYSIEAVLKARGNQNPKLIGYDNQRVNNRCQFL